MASKPSKTTHTSTIVRPDQISQPQSIPTVQQNLNVNPPSLFLFPNLPIHLFAHASVTDATKLTSASPTSRKMFFDEVARKCYEVASQEEKEEEKPVPVARRPTTLSVTPQNTLQSDDKQGRYHKLQPQMQGQPIP